MLKSLIVAVPVLVLGSGLANAGKTIDVAGTMACVNDKWNESEPGKGHSWPNMPADALSFPTIPTHRSTWRTARETTR